ncbi:4'-phosphopantetheinyl transferase sfp [compost metagenome]
MGLSLPLESFTIRIDNDGIELNTQNEFKHCHFKQYDIDPAYKMSVCAQHGRFPDNVRLLDINELYKLFLAYV